MKRLLPALAAAAVTALAFAAVAAADKEKVQLTAEGQAAARAAVLVRGDLGGASGWSGGRTKPDISSTFPCATYHPKQSDLVLTGAASSVWKHAGLQFNSQAQVLETPEMVRLDWQRTVLAPQVFPCLRMAFAKELASTGKLVSFARVPFPLIATYTRAFRAVVEVTGQGGSARIMVDIVVAGKGRTEITLMTTAPLVARQEVAAAEVRLARLLVARVRA